MSTPDFFRSRLDAMIDLRHPLAVLATKMSWVSIETTLAPLFERRSRDGRVSEAVDLFGSNSLELAGAHPIGAPQAHGRPLEHRVRHEVAARDGGQLDERQRLRHHTIRKYSLSVQRRSRVKLRTVVSPSPVGDAMVNEV